MKTEETVNLPKTESETFQVWRKLIEDSPLMVEKYKLLIGHTDGLIRTSMAYAYAKGLSDAAKLILKETKKDEKPV